MYVAEGSAFAILYDLLSNKVLLQSLLLSLFLNYTVKIYNCPLPLC